MEKYPQAISGSVTKDGSFIATILHEDEVIAAPRDVLCYDKY